MNMTLDTAEHAASNAQAEKVEMTWIQTRSGRRFDLFDPQPAQFYLEDVIKSLAWQVRYTGHCSQFYTVLEHSVIVAQLIARLGGTRIEQLCGLFHDGTEAYCSDVVTPLKRQLPEYRVVEDKIWIAFARKYGLPEVMPAVVKQADLIALMSEKMALLGRSPSPWGYPHIEADPDIVRELIQREQVPLEVRIAQNIAQFRDLAHKLSSIPENSAIIREI
jgi:hypothetical protein